MENLQFGIEGMVVIIYLIITLLVGILSGRRIKNFQEYAIGDRKLPTIIMGITLSATIIGGGSALGTATEVFKYGVIVIIAKYGVSLGAIFTAYCIIPRMGRFLGHLSIGEIMGTMYGKNVRIITGISGALLCIGRVAAQIMALGFIMKYLFGFSELFGAFLGTALVIIYSSFGGIRSVVFTDVLQFIAIAVTIPIILNIGFKYVGGYDGLLALLPPEKITVYPNDEMFLKYFIVFLYMSIPMLSPPLTQRILMSKSLDQAKKSFIFFAITEMIFTTIAGLIGLISYTINSQILPNSAFLNLVNELGAFNIWLKTIAIIGLLSVIMSTIDSYLNTVTTSVLNDVMVPNNILISSEKGLFYARLSTVTAGVMAMVLGLYFDNIFELAIYSSNFWSPLIVGPLLLGIFGIKIKTKACYLSMICGMSTFLLWECFDLKTRTYIYSIIPSMIASIVVLLSSIMYQRKLCTKNL